MSLVTVSGKIFTVLGFSHGAHCFYQYTDLSSLPPLFFWGGGLLLGMAGSIV
jgi:hypothetical protein